MTLEDDLDGTLIEDHIRVAILSLYARGGGVTPQQDAEIKAFRTATLDAYPGAREAFDLVAEFVAGAILEPVLTAGKPEDLPDWIPESYADRFVHELVVIVAELEDAGLTPQLPTKH